MSANIKISSDAKQFQQEMQKVTQDLKLMSSELSTATTKAELFGTEQEKLSAKSNELANSIKGQNTVLSLQKQAINALTGDIQKYKDRNNDLAKSIADVEVKLKDSIKSTGEDSKETKQLQQELSKLQQEYVKNEKAIDKSTSQIDKYKIKMNETEKAILQSKKALEDTDKKLVTMNWEKASEQLGKVGDKMTSIGKDLNKKVTLPILAVETGATKLASDLQESMNKIDVAFGNNANEVKKWSQSTLNNFGLAKGTALDLAAGYGDMATSMGFTTDKASAMSKEIVGRAADLSSFKNISIDVANTALTSIFSGETESLKKLGVVMTQANLQEYAYSQGIKKKIQDMTQSEQVQLRYNFVMEKTKNAQGDFARTSDGVANSARVTKESIKELGAQFGNNLLPIVASILKPLNEFLKGLSEMSPAGQKVVFVIAGLLAILPPILVIIGTLITSIGAISGAIAAAGGASAALGAVFATITGPIGITIAIITGLIAVGVLLYENWDTIKNTVSSIWKALTTSISNSATAIKTAIVSTWESIKAVVLPIVDDIANVIKAVWNGVETGFVFLWEVIKAIFISAWTIISSIVKIYINIVTSVINVAWQLIKRITTTVWSAVYGVISTVWNGIVAFINPIIQGIVGVITNAWNAIKSVTTTVFNAVSSIINMVWNSIVNFITPIINLIVSVLTTAWNNIQSVLNTVWNGIKNTTTSVWNSISSFFSSMWGGVTSLFTNTVNGIKNTVSNVWSGILGVTTNIWNNIKYAIMTPINVAVNFVKEQINKIKGFFDKLGIKLPNIKLPHFSLEGEFSLAPPKVPHLAVSWYAEGGIMTKPTLFGFNGNNAMIGGEAGQEGIIPLRQLWNQLSQNFDKLEQRLSNKQQQVIVIHTHVDMEGREIARGTAKYMSEELAYIDNNNNFGFGGV